MKSMKLNFHKKDLNQNTICDDEILISQKDLDVKIDDLVEIYAPEDTNSRLVLQIKSFSDRMKAGTVSLEEKIANTFQLRTVTNQNQTVIVNVVDKKNVVLDSVELFFRDQYFARSDMWILKKSIINSCVYLNKKLDFNNMRCEVFEMWSQGMRMASGYVDENTKIVFRSASSMVYIFLQMSSEMWDYDINGDLYFEKAVNGFLTDLFSKWKTFKCSHDVSIIFFSRTFYEANDISDFPLTMRDCLQKDSKGRYYEDFYRVAIQNERYEDWTTILVELKKLFYHYDAEVIHFHSHQSQSPTSEVPRIPKAYNSSAVQGNFLEVLNMSLNVFERHNLDRSFDRTGQLSVVVSPGAGVYEVDLDLMNLTKQRIIDNGIGSDLVCLGEQPLHAVPLFKFNNDHNNDQYNMPHWINLSFYSTKNRSWTSFIPRIKIPNILPTNAMTPGFAQLTINAEKQRTNSSSCEKPQQNCIPLDYDEYDRNVFKFQRSRPKPQLIHKRSVQHFLDAGSPRDPTVNRRRFSEMTPNVAELLNQTPPNSPANNDSLDGIQIDHRNHSLSQISNSFGDSSFKENHNRTKFMSSRDDIFGSAGKDKPKALINPFDPAHITIKLNSNRRRWTHVFPLGPTGNFMQQHHCQIIAEAKNELNESPIDGPNDQVDCANAIANGTVNGCGKTRSVSESDSIHKNRGQLLTDNSSLWAWGATGELEWNPAITTGVDWKSLVMPACLPLTTDFLPDSRTFQQDYVTYRYDLIPEDKNIIRVHMELVCQRLQQGFQIIIHNVDDMKMDVEGEKCILSIGRIYHKLFLQDNKITVSYFHPRIPNTIPSMTYYYRVRSPDSETYGASRVDFIGEKLESYKWNHLDNYICGDSDYQLQENLKYWRIRLLVLPTIQSITKKIIDRYQAGEEGVHCDLYSPFTIEQKMTYQASFLKLVEIINRIKRPLMKQNSRMEPSKQLVSRASQLSISQATPHESTLNTINENTPQELQSAEISRLSSGSPIGEIFKFMKTFSHLFVKETNNLPPNTFISVEVIDWAKKNLDNVTSDGVAENLFQMMIAEGMIIHISGKPHHPFRVGFYLYCVNDERARDFFERKQYDDGYDFDRQFMEVGVVPQLNKVDIFDQELSIEYEVSSPSHTLESTDFTFRNIVFDLDNNSSKSGRVEWINVKYHSLYDPEQAFEVILEWMVATGNAIPELVLQWCRNKNMHIVPIPWDPFALPFSSKADPLRGPIFIALDTSVLSCDGNDKLIASLQESILVKFGFIPFCDPGSANQRNFVHVSGSIFIMVPTKNQSTTPARGNNKRGKLKQQFNNEKEMSCSPHEDYITRHFSGVHHSTPKKTLEVKTGFLWCWNYMITKRWKTNMTGDENSMRKMMRDFKAFCENQDSRLEQFWRETHNESVDIIHNL